MHSAQTISQNESGLAHAVFGGASRPRKKAAHPRTRFAQSWRLRKAHSGERRFGGHISFGWVIKKAITGVARFAKK